MSQCVSQLNHIMYKLISSKLEFRNQKASMPHSEIFSFLFQTFRKPPQKIFIYISFIFLCLLIATNLDTLLDFLGIEPCCYDLENLQIPTDQDPFVPLKLDDSKQVVPNVAHVNWFTDKPKTFLFHNLLSLLSIHRMMKPEKIYFRHNCKPTGKYWLEALRKVPNLILKRVDPPKKLFGVKLKRPAYETSNSDADRIKVMLESGGVFLDLDVLILKSLEPLRKYPTTIGKCSFPLTSNC